MRTFCLLTERTKEQLDGLWALGIRISAVRWRGLRTFFPGGRKYQRTPCLPVGIEHTDRCRSVAGFTYFLPGGRKYQRRPDLSVGVGHTDKCCSVAKYFAFSILPFRCQFAIANGFCAVLLVRAPGCVRQSLFNKHRRCTGYGNHRQSPGTSPFHKNHSHKSF